MFPLPSAFSPFTETLRPCLLWHSVLFFPSARCVLYLLEITRHCIHSFIHSFSHSFRHKTNTIQAGTEGSLSWSNSWHKIGIEATCRLITDTSKLNVWTAKQSRNHTSDNKSVRSILSSDFLKDDPVSARMNVWPKLCFAYFLYCSPFFHRSGTQLSD